MPPAGKKKPGGHIPFGPDSKKAIDHALRASADLGHDWVGTEHLLLGLIRTEDSLAAHVLRGLDLTVPVVQDIVTARLAANDR